MSARDELFSVFTGRRYGKTAAAGLIKRHRAEVLREAADVVGNDDTCECGGCDTCVPRALAAELRRMADETAPAAAPAPHRHIAGARMNANCPDCRALTPQEQPR